MSVYWNEKTARLVPYVPGEQPRDRKFIKLNTNENPYPPSPAVIDAIKKAACESLRLYPDPASTDLREAAAERYGVKASQVFPGNGSDEVLAFAFAAFFEAATNKTDHASPATEDSVLFPDITYSFYPVYAKLWDIPFKTVPLREDFSVDPLPYLAHNGGVILSNPNAPTGMLLSIDDVKKIAEAAERNRRVFIVDEAYIAFADGGAAALPLLAEFPNLLIIRTFSKEAALAGLRAGLAIGSEELIEGLCRVRDSFNSYTMDRLVQAGGAAALRDAAYYDDINSRIIATRRRVSSELETLGFRVLPSQSNFVFASPPPDCGKSGAAFFAALREHGILVRHFNKPRIADYMRISIGTDAEMDVFLQECKAIIGF